MKTILLPLALLFAGLQGFTQSMEGNNYEDLMARSRKARTTAIVMVSTGPVVAVGGIGTLIYGIIQKENGDFNYYYDANGNYVQGNRRSYNTEIVVGATAALAGMAIALSSIYFTNKANDLRDEAKRMKLKVSTDRINIPGFQNGFANNARQMKLSLVVPL
jgi:hypothetical protein